MTTHCAAVGAIEGEGEVGYVELFSFYNDEPIRSVGGETIDRDKARERERARGRSCFEEGVMQCVAVMQ